MGRPMQTMWMTIPIIIILNENGLLLAKDSGTTTRLMKKYTAMPYSTPDREACWRRNGRRRLTR
jgi:hypothetical protein